MGSAGGVRVIGTIFLLAYLAGCGLFLVPTARFLLNDTVYGEPETSDYVMAAAIALCCVCVWPLYIPGWWIVQMLKTDDSKEPAVSRLGESRGRQTAKNVKEPSRVTSPPPPPPGSAGPAAWREDAQALVARIAELEAEAAGWRRQLVPVDLVEILRELADEFDQLAAQSYEYDADVYRACAERVRARTPLAHRDTAETTVEWGRSDDVSTAIRPMPSEAFARSQIKHWGEYHGRPGQKLWRREVGPWRPVSPEPQPENEKESSP